ERFQRLRGVRNNPPEATWKPSQMTARATSMPSILVSSSVALRNRTGRLPPVVGTPCDAAFDVTSAMQNSRRSRGYEDAAAARAAASLSIYRASAADVDSAGRHALADHILGDPARVD